MITNGDNLLQNNLCMKQETKNRNHQRTQYIYLRRGPTFNRTFAIINIISGKSLSPISYVGIIHCRKQLIENHYNILGTFTNNIIFTLLITQLNGLYGRDRRYIVINYYSTENEYTYRMYKYLGTYN